MPQSHPSPEDMLAALREARRLDNLTVCDAAEHAAWRREVDRLLGPEEPAARYDAPARVEHRAFVDSLFHPPR